MRKYMIFALGVTLMGCSKESDLGITNAAGNEDAHTVLASVQNGFKVGEVSGNTVQITYNMNDLSELAACAISESEAGGLNLELFSGSYFLSGVGTSEGTITTFSLPLALDGGDLYWVEGTEIMMCHTTSSTPCDLTLEPGGFSCYNPDDCSEDTFSAGPHPKSCQWPWGSINK
jgi:hypothetical protein